MGATRDLLDRAGFRPVDRHEIVKEKSVEEHVIWDNATSYCNNLELACKTNWRLPTKTELASLIDMNQTPKIVSTLSAKSLSKYEWTSTMRAGYNNQVWGVSFSDGSVGSSNSTGFNHGNIRCVHP